MMKKYFLITYGCQRNRNDSERIAAVLEDVNYNPTSNINEADLILINACSVRQSAIDRIWGQTKKFKKLKMKNKKLKTVLTGCVLKEDKKKFKDRFDLIFEIYDLPKLPKFLKAKSWELKAKSLFDIQPKYQTKFRAYIPIITGCSNFCTYCVVPYTRGPEISRPADEIICEIKSLIKRNYKDIWLLGENVNCYYWPIRANSSIDTKGGIWRKFGQKSTNSNGINFAKLLKLINEIPGNFWIHFTSSHPKYFSDELIEAVASCEKVGKYINLPVQSGDDEILRKMNRPYTINQYRKLVKKIREKIPGVCLSTDVIVGFPGETKKQFENTVKLFEEIKFDMAYIAQYSERPGTAASKLRDDISHQEKERRDKVLTKVLAKTALEKNRKYIGKEVKVLVEKRKNEFLIGKTKTYKTIKFATDQDSPREMQSNFSKRKIISPGKIGQFVMVEVIDAMPWGLKGKLKSKV